MPRTITIYQVFDEYDAAGSDSFCVSMAEARKAIREGYGRPTSVKPHPEYQDWWVVTVPQAKPTDDDLYRAAGGTNLMIIKHAVTMNKEGVCSALKRIPNR